MSPILPAPDALAVPGPVWLFKLLLHTTFVLHLLAMNFLLGGAVIAFTQRVRVWRGGGDPEGALAPSASMARWLEKKLPTMFALTVTFGVAPLLFLQVLYGHLFYTSSVIMAWPWLLIVPILMVTYYFAYALSWNGDRFGAWETTKGWKVAGGLVILAFLFSNNMGLAIRPEVWAQKYAQSASGLHLNLDDPTFWPRLLHFLFAAVAVTGMVVAAVGAKRIDRGDEGGRPWLQSGALWYMIPTALQIMTGLWWLITLPREVMMPLMGDDTAATIVFMISMTLPILSLITVVLALRAKRAFPMIHASAWLLLLTVIGMVLTRNEVRENSLAPYFRAESLVTEPQWGILAIFLALFVVAIASVAWMAVTLARSGHSNPTAA